MTLLHRVRDRLLEVPIVYRAWQAPFAGAKLRPFLQQVDTDRVRRVLDVGCGPGTNAPVFRSCDYVGVDVNPEYIATASRRHAGRFVVGDVSTEEVLPAEHFDCVFVNSLMHHLDDGAVRGLLRRLARLTSDDGAVHILDLVLPEQPSAARLMARLDRGPFARPLEHWRRLFAEHLVEKHFEPYPLGIPGLPLWQMLYFVGVRR